MWGGTEPACQCAILSILRGKDVVVRQESVRFVVFVPTYLIPTYLIPPYPCPRKTSARLWMVNSGLEGRREAKTVVHL